MGGLGHRPLGRVELLLQAAGADHLPARHGVFPCNPPRQATRNGAATRCENPLAPSRGQACVHQHTIGIAVLHRTEATPTLRRGRKFNLGGILDRQHMSPGAGRAGQRAPSFDDLRRRHPSVREEPSSLQLALTVTAQPAQAYRLARHHPFEDRTPPLSRRRSPNDPSDNSMAAPVLRLPQGSESYPLRVGQAENLEMLRTPHYMCACPSPTASLILFDRPLTHL